MLPKPALAGDNSTSRVNLKRAFGHVVSAALINLSARLVGVEVVGTGHVPVLISCAVTNDLCGDLALIAHEDYVALCEGLEDFVSTVELLAGTEILFDDPRIHTNRDAVRLESKAVKQVDTQAVARGDRIRTTAKAEGRPGADLVRVRATAEYRMAQLADPTLLTCGDAVEKQDFRFLSEGRKVSCCIGRLISVISK